MTAPMTSREALLPCPFCGGEAQRYDIDGHQLDTNVGGSAIECKSCHASTALHFDRKENLTSSWNDRASPAQAPGWRCFHCGEVFTDAEAAKEHFGPDTEWQPGCIDPLTKDEKERRADQVAMYEELDRERDASSHLTNRDYVLGCFERDLAKLFSGAKSVTQAYLVLDAMEGRALAAEERLAIMSPVPSTDRGSK